MKFPEKFEELYTSCNAGWKHLRWHCSKVWRQELSRRCWFSGFTCTRNKTNTAMHYLKWTLQQHSAAPKFWKDFCKHKSEMQCVFNHFLSFKTVLKLSNRLHGHPEIGSNLRLQCGNRHGKTRSATCRNQRFPQDELRCGRSRIPMDPQAAGGPTWRSHRMSWRSRMWFWWSLMFLISQMFTQNS